MHLDEIRAQVRAAVADHRAADEREVESLAAFLTAFDRLDRPFDEDADPTHVTASAIVIGDRGVILHRHKRLGIWLQPGGHIDPGELSWDAAVRETREETGLAARHPAGTPKLVHVDVHPGPRGHTHLDLRYLLLAGDEDPSPPEGESPDVAWFAWPQALGMAEAGLIGGLEAAQPRNGVRLRRARPSDGPGIAATFLGARRAFLASVPIVHDDADVAVHFGRLAAESDCWVAESKPGDVVGFAMIGDVWLDHLYMAPGWTGQGIGRDLLTIAMTRRRAGLQLWTFQVNAGARRFYERAGFHAVEFTDGAANEEHEPDVRYVWEP